MPQQNGRNRLADGNKSTFGQNHDTDDCDAELS